MANYESVLIARQDLGASQVSNIVSDLSDIIKKEGGEVVRVDNWGLKNLAYRIKKNRKGHYVVMNIAAPANAIAEFERIMRFNEDIIRYMTVKVDEFSEDSSASNDKDSVEGEETTLWLNKYSLEEKKLVRFPVKTVLKSTTKM